MINKPLNSSGRLLPKRVFLLIAMIMVFFLAVDDAFARRGGGFSMGRSFSTRGFSSRSSGSVWGSSNRRTGTYNRQSLSGTRGNTRGVSQAKYQRARANGTAFKSKSQAEQSFVSRNKSQYPSRYGSQPKSRPSHIPQSTRVDGRNVNVGYSSQLGGYGYMHPTLGTWMMYSAMTDAAMLGTLMSSRGYYYGAGPGAHYAGRSSNFWSGLMVILIIISVFFVLRSGSNRYY